MIAYFSIFSPTPGPRGAGATHCRKNFISPPYVDGLNKVEKREIVSLLLPGKAGFGWFVQGIWCIQRRNPHRIDFEGYGDPHRQSGDHFLSCL